MKPEVVFIFPNCVGGVSSFNRNIINYSSLKSYFNIKVILLSPVEDKRNKFTDYIDADEKIEFAFSYRENHYHVCRRLANVIGDNPGCVITDNEWPLKSASVFGTQKKIIYLIHDYFYIAWAMQFADVIDSFIAHSSFFKDILLAADIDKFQNRVHYIPYGVCQPDKESAMKRNAGNVNLIFLGRLVESKGVGQLKKIDCFLNERDVQVNWTIVGSGPLKTQLLNEWGANKNVTFKEAKDTDEVYAILEKQDVLVFPSKFEGTPVSIMESMSRGVVPVVSDLPGGTRDMVSEEIGFRCNPESPKEFADAIEKLCKNRSLLEQMRQSSLQRSKRHYDIENAANEYFSFFIEESERQCVEKKRKVKVHFNFLDKPFLPNPLVIRLRTLRSKAKSI